MSIFNIRMVNFHVNSFIQSNLNISSNLSSNAYSAVFEKSVLIYWFQNNRTLYSLSQTYD